MGRIMRAVGRTSHLLLVFCLALLERVAQAQQNGLLSNVRVGTVPSTSSQPIEYVVTFTNEWTPQNHPPDYPSTAHWSPPVFSSHNANYRMWGSGIFATQGVEIVAEFGATGPLREELDEARAAGNVLSVIVGRGMFGLDRVPTQILGSTLTVDSDHPYISGISMIAPSSDWFSGVRNVKPISDDGFWYDSFTVAGFPYDAGTNTGVFYNGPFQKTRPPVPIFRLTPETVPSSNVFVLNDDVLPVLTITFDRVGAPPPGSDPPPQDEPLEITAAPTTTPTLAPTSAVTKTPTWSPTSTPFAPLPLDLVVDETLCPTQCGQDQVVAAGEYFVCFQGVRSKTFPDPDTRKAALRKCRRRNDKAMFVALGTSCRTSSSLKTDNFVTKTRRQQKIIKVSVKGNFPLNVVNAMLKQSACP